MIEQQRLVMKFKDENGKNMIISVYDPKDGIKAEEVKPVMDDIIAKQVMIANGFKVKETLSAEVITVKREPLIIK